MIVSAGMLVVIPNIKSGVRDTIILCQQRRANNVLSKDRRPTIYHDRPVRVLFLHQEEEGNVTELFWLHYAGWGLNSNDCPERSRPKADELGEALPEPSPFEQSLRKWARLKPLKGKGTDPRKPWMPKGGVEIERMEEEE
jgi:hypothetical protein